MTIKTMQLIQSEINKINQQLSQSGVNEQLINEKKAHLKVIRMINFIQKNNIDISKKVITLPFINGHGYYAYRLMIDNEVDNPEKWTELKEINGELAEFIAGDQIITA